MVSIRLIDQLHTASYGLALPPTCDLAVNSRCTNMIGATRCVGNGNPIGLMICYIEGSLHAAVNDWALSLTCQSDIDSGCCTLISRIGSTRSTMHSFSDPDSVVRNRDREAVAESILLNHIRECLYGVRVKIYCRPTCPREKSPNVMFYDTKDQPRSDEFWPCKRCKPDTKSLETEKSLSQGL